MAPPWRRRRRPGLAGRLGLVLLALAALEPGASPLGRKGARRGQPRASLPQPAQRNYWQGEGLLLGRQNLRPSVWEHREDSVGPSMGSSWFAWEFDAEQAKGYNGGAVPREMPAPEATGDEETPEAGTPARPRAASPELEERPSLPGAAEERGRREMLSADSAPASSPRGKRGSRARAVRAGGGRVKVTVGPRASKGAQSQKSRRERRPGLRLWRHARRRRPGESRTVVVLFKDMLQRGKKPDAECCSAVLRVCAKRGDWRTAKLIMQTARQLELELDTAALNDFLMALSRGGHHREAVSVFLLLFAASADSFSKKALQSALPWMPSFGPKGLEADLVSFQTAMKACHRGDHIDMAVAVWRCLEVELRRTQSFSNNNWRRPRARGGRDSFRRQVVPIRPDVSLWSMYISLLLRHGYEAEALVVLSQMTAAGIPPTRRCLQSWDAAAID
uniref:Pentacotripeptide-repeat region of PRORP domain-containing protein n=1 Tax=Phaeomonas parva TaxID=124430 RepID=A0A7S1UE91_9STRA|mmetsp:Transcript_43685/g.137151  ORF Transcript_43685/g.137151 Transcript_43685/m.137151 type:complete len:448 (+) Transcript_43685:169-1512(+)